MTVSFLCDLTNKIGAILVMKMFCANDNSKLGCTRKTIVSENYFCYFLQVIVERFDGLSFIHRTTAVISRATYF